MKLAGFTLLLICLFNSLFAQETLQTVTARGGTTTVPIVISGGSIAPAASGNATGSLNLSAGTGGPSLSIGIVNTNTTTTHWGWIQTAFINSAGTYGLLALNPYGGNVGVGTTTPQYKLSVIANGKTGFGIEGNNNSFWGCDMQITRNSASPSVGRAPCIQFADETSGLSSMVQSYQGQLQFFNSNSAGWFEAMRLAGNGNVGIGTTSPDQKLTVNGTLHATSVKVDSTVPTPDYVFDKNYNLASLREVEAYIGRHHHLPEISSAQQVAKNGIDLGDMNVRLLKKVEELTLYLIEKDKQLNNLESKVKKLQVNNKHQQNQINALNSK